VPIRVIVISRPRSDTHPDDDDARGEHIAGELEPGRHH
jgi:hypothetical protein